MALPALPVNKTRKSTGNIPTSSSSARSAPTTPSGLRAPSTSHLPPPSPSPLSALPTPKSNTNGGPAPQKTIRKTVSINSFPQPPRGDNRGANVPPSPLGADKPPRAARRSKSSRDPMHNNFNTGTPSLLNGSGEGKSIASVRISDGLVSVGSETQSRSSSAQDSYSTSATTYDDPPDSSAAKPETSASEKRASKADGKGNVVVSVRVRPTANGDNGNPEGEWMVDGRRSLISYKGKEGGNHFYGKHLATPVCPPI